MINKKFKLPLLAAFLGLMIAGNANAQKYKTAADTPALNKEYRQINADLTDLNNRLINAQGKTNTFQGKVTSSSEDAQSAEVASKKEAATATNGNLSDLRKEEKKAKKANKEAKDEKDAQKELKDNQKEIKHLNQEISKKQKRLAELDKERNAIMGQ